MAAAPFEDSDPQGNPGISRRAVLVLLGSAILPGTALAQANAATPSAGRSRCVITPEQTEGPYFVDRRLNRSDIRTDPASGAVKAGVPLTLRLSVAEAGGTGCVPLQGAMVDVWHCDAEGVYSSVDAGRDAQADKPFLRGYQVTGPDGTVQFSTIYPGWYPGRATHIHFKIRTTSSSGRRGEFTSQLYFDDAVTRRVHSQPPYARRNGHAPKNEDDTLFKHDGGSRLMLSLNEAAQGYVASFSIALRTA